MYTQITHVIKSLRSKNILPPEEFTFKIEVDCIIIGNTKIAKNLQAAIKDELGISNNELKIIEVDSEIYSVEYSNSVLLVKLKQLRIDYNENFIERINYCTKGIILTNNYTSFDNKHIGQFTKNLNRKFTVHKDSQEALTSILDTIIYNFNFEDKSYELINDLLSQGKLIVIAISKYTIYDIINTFIKYIPEEYKLNIIHNILGCFQYYIMPLNKGVINDFVVGMSAFKNDIFKGKLTPSTLETARVAFEEEINTSKVYNADDMTPAKLNSILKRAVKLGASDISLSSGSKPKVRVHKKLIQLEDDILLTPEIMYNYGQIVLKTDELKALYELEKQADSLYSIQGLGRFRVSVYKQRNSTAISFRFIEENAWTVEKAGIPKAILNLLNTDNTTPGKNEPVSKARNFKDGLIMITGPVNTGKSTTMNAIIDYINENKDAKIITIEDPVETSHKNKRALIEQRDIGTDCSSYEEGLKQCLRSDPDVISVGEIRTYSAADTILKTARSGHLALSTFHTPTAVQTLQSFLQMFPENSRELVRTMLAECLRMIYCQKLLPRKGGGLVVAQEILLNTDSVRSIIANSSAKLTDLANPMTSGLADGMITMDRSIANLYLNNKVELEVALKYAVDKKIVQDYINIQGRR